MSFEKGKSGVDFLPYYAVGISFDKVVLWLRAQV